MVDFIRPHVLDDDGAVFAAYRSELIRYATALVGPSEAEDAVMTVVDRTVRRHRLSELDNPKAYLMRGVLNEARSLGRRKVVLPLDEATPGPGHEGMVEILAVLMDLPVRQRAVVYLHYWERQPVNEVAETLGIGPGTVKRYLHLARQKLRGVL